MAVAATAVVLLGLAAAVDGAWLADLRGDYCRTRSPQCCPGRRDDCSVPILGTLCYCDLFCNRTTRPDCCPDFFEVCLGVRPEPTSAGLHSPNCTHGGQIYYPGNAIKINCNKCTCQQTSGNGYGFVCEKNVCLVRPELVEQINSGHGGWTATNYTMFWGRTLEDGVRYRLGTFRPTNKTISMNEISIKMRKQLPENFDSRLKWPNHLQPVRDQGDCGASWAFSTTALAADRLAIQSEGTERLRLSPQQMVSCQTKKQQGCEGGHLDRAWWYLRKHGIAEEDCFPYRSGGAPVRCAVKRVHKGRARCADGQERPLYKWTPPYRIPPREEAIMQEIFTNGPVQATFRVMPDFFLYRSGVYRHGALLGAHLPPEFRLHGWHSVRILGWGVDRSRSDRPVKYWLCANSWGRLWGEEGLFRVERGRDEGDIESFVVGVWARRRRDGRRSNLVGPTRRRQSAPQ